jgi:hypothetical protein
MKKRFSVYVIILVAAIPITIGLEGFVHDIIVVPMLNILMVGTYFLQIIPQSILWMAFMLFAIIFCIRSLKKTSTTLRAIEKSQKNITGPVSIWVKRIHDADIGVHSESDLKQHLKSLLISTVAYNDRKSLIQIKGSLKSDDLKIPSEIQEYFNVCDTEIPPTHKFLPEIGSLLRTWLGKRKPTFLNTESENVVKYMENLLKVKHDH